VIEEALIKARNDALLDEYVDPDKVHEVYAIALSAFGS